MELHLSGEKAGGREGVPSSPQQPSSSAPSLGSRWPCDSGLASESITTPEYHCQLVGEHVTQAMVVTANKHHLRALQKH